MTLKKYIPNGITLLNLLSGSLAVVFAVNNHFVTAAFFVFLGIFFDFFDGFFARKLKVQSPLGVQLDSLADMVTSGLAPGVILFKLISLASDEQTFLNYGSTWEQDYLAPFNFPLIALFGLFVVLASAYRLAKFNLDEDQQDYFKGLPTPANTLLIVSLPLILEFQHNDLINQIILNQWFLIGLSLVSCYMLNASIKLFALKFKTWSFKDNAIRYIFLLLSIVLLIVLQFAAIPVIILLYIILSLINKKH